MPCVGHVTLLGEMSPKTAPPEVGERLKKARLAKKLKQAELADAIDVRPGTIYRIETAGYWPGRKTVKAICDVLGVSEAWLLYGSDDSKVPDSETPSVVEQYLTDDPYGKDTSPQVQKLLRELDYSSIGMPDPTTKDVHRARELIEINIAIARKRNT